MPPQPPGQIALYDALSLVITARVPNCWSLTDDRSSAPAAGDAVVTFTSNGA